MRVFRFPHISCAAVIFAFICVCGMWSRQAGAEPVWQWSLIVKNARENPGVARAFLWVPPDCRNIRGVVVSQHNMEEESILENSKFRAGMSDLGFAEVWVAPSFDHLFRFAKLPGENFNGPLAGEVFNALMRDLAGESGYGELEFAPVVAMGHSAAASWPYYLAAWDNNRALCGMSVSGQWPYFRDPTFAPDIWGNRTIDYVPMLETMGEWEAAVNVGATGARDRQNHPLLPLSMLANPGQGHFAATDIKCEYLALYIKKAAQYRLPVMEGPYTTFPTLKPIDPTKTGWLADRWRGLTQDPTAPAAPVGQYKGDPRQAFWFFDEEIATATQNYQAAHHGKKVQLVGMQQDGQFLAQTTQHLQLFPKWEPQADGITFKLTGAFYDTVPPPANARPAGWAGAAPGTPIGHAATADISLDRVCGPFIKIGPDTFRLSLQKETTGKERQLECVFIATHPGDADYRPAAQQAQMNVPPRVTTGAEQTITFPPIADQKAGVVTVALGATSSAGVPVYYYVREGPAELDGTTLKLAPIPPRAKFPIKVTIVAWQYGHTTEPALKSAEPVERSFLITQ